jgi:hypothetical protein
MNRAFQQLNTVFSALPTEGVHGFAETYTGSLLPPRQNPFPIRPAQDRLTLWCRECVTDNPRKGQRRFRRFRRCTRVFLQGSDPFLLAVRESKWRREPPTRLIAAFYCMVRVDTCRPCDCMRSGNVRASHHLEITCPSKGLRLKHIMHFSFGIILKYYSQGLSPLGSTLSPFFPPPAPNSLPTLWMLSPPSLIHRGRSAPGGVYILLIILHTYKYISRLLAFNT